MFRGNGFDPAARGPHVRQPGGLLADGGFDGGANWPPLQGRSVLWLRAARSYPNPSDSIRSGGTPSRSTLWTRLYTIALIPQA